MKKIIFLLTITIGILSCEKENLKTETSLEETYQEALEPTLKDPTYPEDRFFTDGSGRIEFVISGIIINTSDAPNPNLLSATAYVPDGFVCVGGITYANRSIGSGAGTLMTMSAPLTGFQSFNGWRGEVKQHLFQDGNTDLVVSAVGIRLKGNDGNYIAAEELKNYLKIFTRTSSRASHPSTSVSVSSGYKLIGGGAKVNWSGAGNLLTESYPSGNTWRVKSKDHGIASPATITAYAIGIKNNIPNFGEITSITKSECDNKENYEFGIETENSLRNSEYGASCGGARTTYNGYGRMLTGISTGNQGSFVSSKDHGSPDSGILCAYTVAIKKAL